MTDAPDTERVSPDPHPAGGHDHAHDHATGPCIRAWPHDGACITARGFRYTP